MATSLLRLPLFRRTLQSPFFTSCIPPARVNSSFFPALSRAFFKPVPIPVTTPRIRVLQFIKNNAWNATHRDRLFNPRLGRRRTSIIDAIPPNFIIYGILGLNCVVFLVWVASKQLAEDGKPSLYRWMLNNFTSCGRNIASGRIWCLTTACFSHMGFGHLLFNSFTFYFFGPAVLAMTGNALFLSLYLGSGIIGNIVSAAYNILVKGQDVWTCGASGSIYAMLTLFACANPFATIYVYVFIPVPAWACVTGLIAFDVFSAANDIDVKTDHAGHVGGLLSGIAYYLAMRHRIFLP